MTRKRYPPQKTVFLISIAPYTFVSLDASLLAETFHTETFYIQPKHRIDFVKKTVHVVHQLIMQRKKVAGVLFWFADMHALLPFFVCKLLKIKTVVIAGGYDVAAIPELGYGAHLSRMRSFLIRYLLRKSEKVVAVSNFLASELAQQCKIIAPSQITILNNVTSEVFFSLPFQQINHSERNYDFICVSAVQDKRSFLVKGIDRLAALAAALPEKQFLWIGLKMPLYKELPASLPPNLKVLKAISQHELIDYYLRSKFVIQLSRFESFGIAVLEGILCGCIPICTENTGCAEIVAQHPNGLVCLAEKYLIDVPAFVASLISEFKTDESAVMKFRALYHPNKRLKALHQLFQ